jgi:large subunit ribosomal protein L24
MQASKPVKNPGKQRKLLYNAPAHVRHKSLAARLSQELIASKGIKTLPVRKGDTIRIQRGDNKGFEGKVSRIDMKRYRVFVEGLTREKVDGTNIFVSVHPSKIMIKTLNLDDKWRKQIVERKQKMQVPAKKEAPAKKIEKPAAKAVQAKEAKLVKKPKVEAAKKEKPSEEKPVAKPKAAKKPVATKKEKAPAAKKKETTVKEEIVVKKEKKPAAEKKKPATRKTAASKKEGGK